MTTGQTIALTIWTFVSKVMFLLFNMLSRFVIAFLPRSKHLLISWSDLRQDGHEFEQNLGDGKGNGSPACHGPWGHKESDTTEHLHFTMGPDAMILVFWMLSFKPAFSLASFTFIKRLFSSSSLSTIRVMSSVYLRSLIFLLAILIPVCASSFYMHDVLCI